MTNEQYHNEMVKRMLGYRYKGNEPSAIKDDYMRGSLHGYFDGRKSAINEVLEIIDKADNEYEIWSLKFQKVKEAVKDLGGKIE